MDADPSKGRAADRKNSVSPEWGLFAEINIFSDPGSLCSLGRFKLLLMRLLARVGGVNPLIHRDNHEKWNGV
jgi:hypothetical protein